MTDEGLQLWIDWFDFSGRPWEEDGYGRTFCFFCGEEGGEKHADDCVFVKAKNLVEQATGITHDA